MVLLHLQQPPPNLASPPKTSYVRARLIPLALLPTEMLSQVATKNSQIQSVPRRLLDPRRPNRKVTNQEAEEQLMQYEPVLASQPQRVLSHNYEVRHSRAVLARSHL
jgi:hypothetical protein